MPEVMCHKVQLKIRELTRDLMRGGPKGPPPPCWFFAHNSNSVGNSALKFVSTSPDINSTHPLKTICPRSPKVKSYRGQTEVMFDRFCQKKLFQVKRRRAVYLQDTNTKFGLQT